METNRPTLTIGILTLNEAPRLQRCIESARFADEVIVIDSGSTDNTVSIARQLGAKIIEASDWQGFAIQRNRLLAQVKTDYVFFLDADEMINESLAREILTSLHNKIDIGPGFLFCFFVALECFLRYCALGYDSLTSSEPASR